jgi:hypothetical protein
MVQGIENLTKFVGTIVASEPHPELADYDTVTVAVEQSQPVEGKANIIDVKAGGRMEVTMRRELLAGAGTGSKIQFRAQRILGGVMSEPHPEAGNFKIEP